MGTSMHLTYCCGLLLLKAALLAHGYTLRGNEAPGPPLVDSVKHNLQIGTAAAKISALNVKSTFAANSAQAAAAQASSARIRIEELYMKTKNVMPELNAIKSLAKSQAKEATASSKDTVESYKEMEKQLKTVPEQSKLLAVQEVKKLLKEKYNELSEWRHKVLANPWEKGQVAATKAAKPYFGMMGNFAGSMAIYGLESGAMKSQAASDAASAESLAAGVEAKKEAGDPIGAAQDEEMAQALKIQSGQLAGRAATLDGQIAQMKNVVPQYSGAAAGASWNAEYAENPDGLPPPPVDPNFAFTPAPP